MHPWTSIPRDSPDLAEIRRQFTVCRRREATERGLAWIDADAAEAWALHDDPGWLGRISLSADWDSVRISSLLQCGDTYWELRREPVKVLVLSAWIADDDTVTEGAETVRDATWTDAFEGDWERHAARAARWIASVPDPRDPFDYTRQHRFQKARDRAVSRLKKWAYERLESAGVPLRWHIEDHRVHVSDRRYCTRVLLAGSDHEAVREEWTDGLPRTRRHVIAADRFRRLMTVYGNVVDLNKVKAGPGLLADLRRELAKDRTPQPSTAPFRTSSWVTWTCPDTADTRRGVVVGESLKGAKVSAVRILPDDGAEMIEARVERHTGRITTCGTLVTPASAPD
ncbi:hypothetical protein ACIG3E_33725 [Streptomyces sp. NPDC053474]|uniref:hypothetical protein n=1 Tax=Streptomyces sp. NPDC053474 TaxID=3365704 RepID=UPI0037D261EC